MNKQDLQEKYKGKLGVGLGTSGETYEAIPLSEKKIGNYLLVHFYQDNPHRSKRAYKLRIFREEADGKLTIIRREENVGDYYTAEIVGSGVEEKIHITDNHRDFIVNPNEDEELYFM